MSARGYFTLMEAVKVVVQDDRYGAVWRDGIVVGRTLEQNARYEIRYTDGSAERNVTADRMQPRANPQH